MLSRRRSKTVSKFNVPVNDTVSVGFRLYGHETNPTPLLFEEMHTGVMVTDGLFSVRPQIRESRLSLE